MFKDDRYPAFYLHVQRQSSLRPNGSRDTLEEYHSHWRAILDVSGLGKGWPEALRCNKGPDEEGEAEDRHDDSLSHEHISQARDLEPEQRRLNDDEQEEAEQLRRSNVSAGREAVWEVVKAGPDGLNHDLQALPALETLRTEPDAGYYASHEDSKVASSHAEACAREDGKVDAEHGTHVAIEHGWNAHE